MTSRSLVAIAIACLGLVVLLAHGAHCLSPSAWVSTSIPEDGFPQGSWIKIAYSGFSAFPMVDVILYDINSPEDNYRTYIGYGPAGFYVVEAELPNSSSNVTAIVCPRDSRGPYCAQCPQQFALY